MATRKVEVTSPKVAKIAGSILRRLDKCFAVQIYGFRHNSLICVGTVDELKAVCASALTQTKDRHAAIPGTVSTTPTLTVHVLDRKPAKPAGKRK